MEICAANCVHQVIEDAVSAGRIVGASVIVAQHGEVILEHHTGWADREEKRPVTEETIFRLASMTKPIVSAATLALVEKDVLSLDTPISCWLPAFTPRLSNGNQAVITLRHLLTHTAGLTYGFLFAENNPLQSAGVSDGIDESVLSLDDNLERLATVPLMFAPGTSWCYSLATDVLGAVLERACNQPLPQIIEEWVTGPLGMKDTTFHLSSHERLAKAYADSHEANGSARVMQNKDKVLLEGCGYIHYAPGRITNKQAYPSAGAGMAGTARDYLIFLEALRNGGQPILSRQSVDLLTSDAVKDFDVPAAGPGFGFSMGFAVVRDSQTANTPRHAGSYDWGGVYGTKMFVDPEIGLSAVMLTNTALEGLTGKFSNDVTRAIYDNLEIHEADHYPGTACNEYR